jgi:hypothetical protein
MWDVARLEADECEPPKTQYRLEDNLLRYFSRQIEHNKKFIEGFNADMKPLASIMSASVDGFAA